jgi:hypothetical protein
MMKPSPQYEKMIGYDPGIPGGDHAVEVTIKFDATTGSKIVDSISTLDKSKSAVL